jgi:hypothetical protein
MRPPRLILLVTLVTFGFSGCGSSNTVWVTGTLLKGGNPYVPPAGHRVGLTFLAMEVQDASGKIVANNEPYAAELNPKDGSFLVPGPEGKGIPAGKYRISVIQKLTRDAFDARLRATKNRAQAFDRETDYFRNEFGPETSPIVRDVNSSGVLTIDLDRPME